MKVLVSIKSLENDLDTIKKWEDFYRDNHKDEPLYPAGSSGCYYTGLTTEDISHKISVINFEIRNKLDKIIKGNTKLLKQLKNSY